MENTKDAVQTPGELNRELKIETNQINVSNRRNEAFYEYLAKRTLEQYEDLVLHALGNATNISIVAAEKLVRNGYAEYVKMQTETIEVEETRRRRPSQSNEAPRKVKRAKLIITLKRSANFKENIDQFNKIKDMNQSYMDKEK